MTSDIDNKEWPDDYLSLKQVNQNNPFTVPVGYFDGLEERIISSVRLNELVPPAEQQFAVPENYFDKLSSNIISRINVEAFAAPDTTNFTVPQDYFNELSNKIASRINIEETASAEAESFTVPQGYFDELKSNIMSRINIEEAIAAEENSFTVPEGYFDNMAAQIQSRVFIEETLSKETPFTVPAGYFENLNREVMNQAAGLEAIKRKGIVKRLISSGTFKYGIAACFALVIGAGIFFGEITTPQAEHDSSYLHKALSEVPDNAIEGYLQLHLDNSDARSIIDKTGQSDLKNISTDDLADYLSNN